MHHIACSEALGSSCCGLMCLPLPRALSERARRAGRHQLCGTWPELDRHVQDHWIGPVYADRCEVEWVSLKPAIRIQ